MKHAVLPTALLLLLVGLLPLAGCHKHRSAGRGATSAEDGEGMADELLVNALADLNDTERFEVGATVYQAIDRLDQWGQSQAPLPDWKVDPLAAPLFAAFAEISAALGPVESQLAAPRDQMELKGVARRLQNLPERLDELGRKVSIDDIEALGRQHEELTRQLESMAKKLADVSREAADNFRVIEEFDKRVKSAEKRACLRELVVVAQELDDPARLQELTRFREFVGQVEALAQRDTKQIGEVASRFEEIAGRARGSSNRLMMEMQFVLKQIANLDLLRGLLQLRELSQALDAGAERLKNAANRTNREDLRELAARFASAGKKRDREQLKVLETELDALAKPRDLTDLKALIAQLNDPIKELARLTVRIDAKAKQLDVENFDPLAAYCESLSKQLQTLAEAVTKLDPAAQPNVLDKQFDAVLAGYEQLAGRIELLKSEMEYLAAVDQLAFPRTDVLAFQEAVWLRDLSKWIRGDEANELSRAKRMFDWTVRNIQLHVDPAGQPKEMQRLLQHPWETLVHGRGTCWDRAWVFILLARQQGIDAAVLAVRDSSDAKRLRPWAVAVLSEGQLYLFDPSLGLPIPAKGGVKRGDSDALEIQPATLEQVVADDSLLRKLDADGKPYPITAAQAKNAVALVEGSPAYLQQRMRMVESRLSGDDRLVLTASPSAEAERLKACRHVTEVRLWNLPYETAVQRAWLGPNASEITRSLLAPFMAPSLLEGRVIRRYADETDAPIFWERQRELLTNPKNVQKQRQRERSYAERREDAPESPLWKGRIRHLKGQLTGEKGAIEFYQMACPSESDLNAAQFEPQMKQVFVQAKQNASYWLGLVAFEQAKYGSAQHHLNARNLEAAPNGPWTPGVKYNLARVLESQGKYAEAIRQYMANRDLVDGEGNVLRGRWLAAATGVPLPEKPSTSPPSKLPELPGLTELPGLPKASPDKKQEPASKPASKPETPKSETPPAKK